MQPYVIVLLAVVLFALGAWPISILLLIIAVVVKIVQPKGTVKRDLEQRIEELEEENKKLRQDLDRQLIQDIIDKTTGK